jgi:hypothetical protein
VNLSQVRAPVAWPAWQWANSGGPSSRTRSERVRAELLGRQTGHIQCPRVRRLALLFGPLEPVAFLDGVLRGAGLDGPEQLRGRFAVPPSALLVLPAPADAPRLDVRTAPPDDVLEQALLLGLCTSHVFDPARPVLWTTTSLMRSLELFEPTGFYA